MRTVKITSLYPVKVDAARKVPGIETGAVRAGALSPRTAARATFALNEGLWVKTQPCVFVLTWVSSG